MEPGFHGHAGQAEQADLVDDFAAAVAAVVATMDVEDILCGGGRGPYVVLGVLANEGNLMICISCSLICFLL